MKLLLGEYKNGFKASYDEYTANYDELLNRIKPSFPQSLRLANIRFRLTLSKSVNFDNSISYTKTKRTRAIYRYFFKVNDAWFTFEAVLRLCRDEGLASVSQKFTCLNVKLNKKLDLYDIDPTFNNLLKSEILSKSQTKKDLNSILDYMKNQSQKGLSKAIATVKKKIEKRKNLTNSDIMAISYAVRNGYVHYGDAAGSGVAQYSAKTKLLCNVYSYSMSYMLKILRFIVSQKL